MSTRRAFSDLPLEIKQQILSYLSWECILSVVSRVTKDLRAIGLRSVETIDCNEGNVTSENQLRLSPLLSPRIKILTLSPHVILVTLALRALQRCPNLTTLKNVHCDDDDLLSSRLFRALEEHGRSLRRISLHRLHFEDLSVVWMRQLTNISMKHCMGLDDRSMTEIGQHCRRLVSFSCYRRPPQYSDVGMNAFLDGVAGSIRRLSFEGDTLSDASFKNLGKCRLLEQLYLVGANGLGLQGLRCVTGLTRLTCLGMECSGLREVSLSEDDYGRAFDGRELGNLEILNLTGMEGVGDAALAAISESCPGLVSLRVDIWDQAPLTDFGVRELIKNCKRLRNLKSARSVGVTRDAFGNSPRDLLDSLPELENVYFTCMDEEFVKELNSLGVTTTMYDMQEWKWLLDWSQI